MLLVNIPESDSKTLLSVAESSTSEEEVKISLYAIDFFIYLISFSFNISK